MRNDVLLSVEAPVSLHLPTVFFMTLLGQCSVRCSPHVATAGAIWSSTSPDFGVNGVLDRFNQVDPTILISVNAVAYNGKVHDHIPKLKQVIDGMPQALSEAFKDVPGWALNAFAISTLIGLFICF
jgi:hypothetical protein